MLSIAWGIRIVVLMVNSASSGRVGAYCARMRAHPWNPVLQAGPGTRPLAGFCRPVCDPATACSGRIARAAATLGFESAGDERPRATQ